MEMSLRAACRCISSSCTHKEIQGERINPPTTDKVSEKTDLQGPVLVQCGCHTATYVVLSIMMHYLVFEIMVLLAFGITPPGFGGVLPFPPLPSSQAFSVCPPGVICRSNQTLTCMFSSASTTIQLHVFQSWCKKEIVQ